MAESIPQLQVIAGDKIPGVASRLAKIVPWVLSAGRPYYDHFLAGYGMEPIIARWLTMSTSEISLKWSRLLIADDDIAGGYIALPGRILNQCRQADLLDLARQLGRNSYSQLRKRVRDLHPLFSPIENDSLYLTRLGILPHKRGQGLSHHLMKDSIAQAIAGGYPRLRLDVCEENHTARNLFEAHGFQTDHRGHALAANITYIGMKHDL